jgi:hypothetical protein
LEQGVPALRLAQVNHGAQTATILLLLVSPPSVVAAERVGMTVTVHLLVTEVRGAEVQAAECPAAPLEAQPVPELLAKDLQVQAAELIGIRAAAVALAQLPHKQEVKLHTVALVY